MEPPRPREQVRHRIPGYDLARFLAVFGFVVVDMVGRMVWDEGDFGAQPEGPVVLHWMHKMWWGRASSMLAVLAGTGLALLFRPGQDETRVSSKKQVVLRRCLFLLVLGHLWNSSTLWSWSILHYYPFFLAIGLLFVSARPRMIAAGALLFIVVSTADTLAFREWPEWANNEMASEASSIEPESLTRSAETGVEAEEASEKSGQTEEQELTAESSKEEMDFEEKFGDPKIWQREFWSLRGQMTDILFDGMYPVFPWMAFVLIGMWVVRLGIGDAHRRRKILIGSLITMALSYGIWWASRGHESLHLLTSVDRWPGLPLYVLSCSAQAVALLCICLSVASLKPNARWIAPLAATGQMTLSIYLFRIFVGGGDRDGLFDWVGFADGSAHTNLVDGWIRVAVFMPVMILVCHYWVRRFGHGPMEALMRYFSDTKISVPKNEPRS